MVLLWDFCAYNKLKIINSFYKHKDIYKFTWEECGCKSIIHYAIVNKLIWPHIWDTRVYRGAELDTDHYLLIFKIQSPKPYFRKKTQKV